MLLVLDKGITKLALDWNPQVRGSKGRPHGTWRRVREDDMLRREKTLTEVKKLTLGRERWKGFVSGL